MCVVLPALVKAVREAGSPELYTISERIYTKRLADQARVLIESGRREGGRQARNGHKNQNVAD